MRRARPNNHSTLPAIACLSSLSFASDIEQYSRGQVTSAASAQAHLHRLFRTPVLLDDPRLEGSVAILRHLELQRPEVTFQRLG